MGIDIGKEKQRLAQDNFLKLINRQMLPTELMTVYLDDKTDDHNIGVYCALIPNDQIERSLNEPSWDLSLGSGLPGTVEYHRDGEKQVSYLRFGDDDGIEPLLIYREFHGMREAYREISEEFRLFHRLYHDRKQDQYIKIDDSGNEHPHCFRRTQPCADPPAGDPPVPSNQGHAPCCAIRLPRTFGRDP